MARHGRYGILYRRIHSGSSTVYASPPYTGNTRLEREKTMPDKKYAEPTTQSIYDDQPMTKQTSVSAHIVQSISVNMSVSEMEMLMDTFGRDASTLNGTEIAIQREFVAAVTALR